MAALRACFETVQTHRDDRSSQRRKLNLEVQGTTRQGAAANVLIHNLSTTGLLIETSADLAVGDAFEVEIPHAGPTSAQIIWNSGSLFGCEFAAPVPNAAISAALLQTPPPQSIPVPWAQTHLPKAREDRADDGETLSLPQLKLRTRALIIVGFCLVAWTLIISAIAAIL
jgi:hypothetical protein